MIDERLATESQRQAAEWVRGLPEETPGMAWRAALNEKVRAEAETRVRRRWRWTLARPALGLALAATLAVVVLVPRAPLAAPAPEKGRVEANLVALHDESEATADVVGTGLNPDEAIASPVRARDPQDDLEAL